MVQTVPMVGFSTSPARPTMKSVWKAPATAKGTAKRACARHQFMASTGRSTVKTCSNHAQKPPALGLSGNRNTWQCVKTLYPCSSHQNSWDLWMFIPLKMVLIGIDP